MRPWMDRASARGRLHGRLLLVLVAVAVIASVAAIWQFSVLRDDDEPDLADIADRTTLNGGATDAAVSITASASASASPSASTSPTEAASRSAAASEPAATSEAAGGGNGDSGPQCTASLTLDDEWEGTVSVTVTVTNTGAEAFGGWEVELAIKHLTVPCTPI